MFFKNKQIDDRLSDGFVWNADDIIGAILRNVASVFSNTSILARRSRRDDALLKGFGIACSVEAKTKCVVTRWLKPVLGRVKLNCDGCSKGNPGLIAGGSILRMHTGEMVWAQADFYQVQTNMYAEAMALLQGVRKCVIGGLFMWMSKWILKF